MQYKKIFDDHELFEEYIKCRRCRIVAEKYGCSDETVRRALIKHNVPRVEKHKRPITKPRATPEELQQIVSEYYETDTTINELSKKWKRSQKTISRAISIYGHGLKGCCGSVYGRKITNEELIEAAKTLNCHEIAQKYGLSEERVFRRARDLGIQVEMRWIGGHWRRRANRYGCNEFDESISLRLLFSRDNGVCQICGKPCDTTDIKNGHIGRLYPTLDHIVPLSKGGNHTWDNVQLAHMACNAGKCDREECNESD